MPDYALEQFIAAAINGLCASPETSTRKPESIAKKAFEIAQATMNLIGGAGTPASE